MKERLQDYKKIKPEHLVEVEIGTWIKYCVKDRYSGENAYRSGGALVYRDHEMMTLLNPYKNYKWNVRFSDTTKVYYRIKQGKSSSSGGSSSYGGNNSGYSYPKKKKNSKQSSKKTSREQMEQLLHSLG